MQPWQSLPIAVANGPFVPVQLVTGSNDVKVLNGLRLRFVNSFLKRKPEHCQLK